MPKSFDTIVIGLGAIGSAAFFHLARAGQNVLGLDQFDPPHSQGSSHGETRIFRRTSSAPEIYVALANRAAELWEQLEQDSRAELLRVTGGLMIGKQDSAAITRSLNCHQNWDIAGELLSAIEIRKRFPQFALPSDHVAFFESGAGYLIVDHCIRAHCSCGVQSGGEIRTNEKVISWQGRHEQEGVIVQTDQEEYFADSLVIASGPWTTDLIPELERPIKCERQVLHWYEPKGSIAQFSAPQFPVYIWHLDSGSVLYGFPSFPEGQSGVKLAVEAENDFCTPETINRRVGQADIDSVTKILRTYIPKLSGRCVATATCMYSPTADNNFVISRHPNWSQVVILAGFIDSGFKFSSAVGEIAKDLVLNQKTPLDFVELRADRFIPS